MNHLRAHQRRVILEGFPTEKAVSAAHRTLNHCSCKVRDVHDFGCLGCFIGVDEVVSDEIELTSDGWKLTLIIAPYDIAAQQTAEAMEAVEDMR